MSYNFGYFYGIESEYFIFFRIPKLLITDKRFKSISAEAKLLYGLMLDRMGLSSKNGWLDECNRVYIVYTIDEIIEDIGCARQKASKLLEELENADGLIERKRQGLGKPNIIYVKNFSSEEAKADVVCSNKEYLCVGCDEIPQAVVRSRLLKLRYGHIEYVLECMKKNTTTIRNIKNYLLTALYNSYSTIDHYYDMSVNQEINI